MVQTNMDEGKLVSLVFFTDPGHGWLAVPIDMLAQLGITDKITSYSYYDPKTCYVMLEEDCDAGTFIKAAQGRGWTLKITEEDSAWRDSWIRSLPRFILGKNKDNVKKCFADQIRREA